MNYKTNVIVENHNAWTLTKHLAQSVNKTAGMIDAKVFGTKTNIIVVPTRSPVVEKASHVKDFFIGFGCVLVVIILIIGLFSGKLSIWDCAP